MDSNEINLRTLVDARFISLERELDLRFAALEREMNLELRSSAIALDKANDTLSIRLEAMNEFRAQMGDQTKTFATRNEVNDLRDAHEDQLRSLSRQVYIMVGGLGVLQVIIFLLLNQA